MLAYSLSPRSGITENTDTELCLGYNACPHIRDFLETEPSFVKLFQFSQFDKDVLYVTA